MGFVFYKRNLLHLVVLGYHMYTQPRYQSASLTEAQTQVVLDSGDGFLIEQQVVTLRSVVASRIQEIRGKFPVMRTMLLLAIARHWCGSVNTRLLSEQI